MTNEEAAETDTVRYFGNRIPFLEHIGVRAGQLTAEQASARLAFDATLANSGGHMHGGSLMSALDFAMSAAARSIDPAEIVPSTIEMKTSFIRPAASNVEIVARCIHRGRSIAFCEAVAHGADGKLVASASAVFKLNYRSARSPVA